MPQIEVMLEVPLKIATGLASGQLERVGGVAQGNRFKFFATKYTEKRSKKCRYLCVLN